MYTEMSMEMEWNGYPLYTIRILNDNGICNGKGSRCNPFSDL